MIQLPKLSEEDPAIRSEGSLDPLGLYSISDALAVRLVPGVRERQSHPRFLTTTAVSLAVCSAFDDEIVAADGVSAPWQVFEWYLVEGLVRTANDGSVNRGLPGQDKVGRVIRDRVPLSAPRYLKTPTVFGYHGVYRVLAKTLDVEIGGRLGDAGYRLLQTWSSEQGLEGFYSSVSGPGSVWRQKLIDAITDGLANGYVARSGGWSGWNFFREHLAIYEAGPRERTRLTEVLLREETGHLREIWQFLLSDHGRAIWQEHESERLIHDALRTSASDELRHLLETILTYELFARLLQDAFDDCLENMTRSSARVHSKDLADLRSIKNAAAQIPDLYVELLERLGDYQEAHRLQYGFSVFQERMGGTDWVQTLLDHHTRIQSRKPPNGKAPWFDCFDDNSYVVRPGYLRSEGGQNNEEYVHTYRCGPLISFATDLGHFS